MIFSGLKIKGIRMKDYFFFCSRRIFSSILSLFVIAGFLLLSFQSCQRKESKDNFILVTLDTQRADFISAYNPENAATPYMDHIAQEGTLYENCYSLIPITLPSHASIFFSEPPHGIKNYNNGQIIGKRRKRPSFVNIFKKEGYQTAAFVSLGVLKAKFGLGDGFDLYEDDFLPGRWYLTAEEVNQKVFRWLAKNKEEKFFLWIHYSDPHDPYAPPDLNNDLKLFLNRKLISEYCLRKYEEHGILLNLRRGKNRLIFEVTNEDIPDPGSFHARLDKLDFTPQLEDKNVDIKFLRGWSIQKDKELYFCKNRGIIDLTNSSRPCQVTMNFRGKLLLSVPTLKKLYRQEVEYMDGEIGRLWNTLKELNLLQRTHVLMVGDHGEGLGEFFNHQGIRHIGHIQFLYDIYMRVPLIIYDPHATQKNLRIKTPVTLVDIAPTVVKTMGLKKFGHFQGRNLQRLKEDKSFCIFEETYKPEAVRDRFALLQIPWHLIFVPEERKYELYNLNKDPEEKHDIYDRSVLPQEVVKLKQKLDFFAQEVLKGKEEIRIDKKTEEMLRALGYIK